jgi:hypothetical protein
MGSDILLLYTVRFSGWVSSKVLKQNPSQDLLKSIINIISTRYEFSRFAFAHEFWKNFDKIQKIVPQLCTNVIGNCPARFINLADTCLDPA